MPISLRDIRATGVVAALVLFAGVVSATLFAQPPKDYWADVDTSNQQTLTDTIYETIRDHIRIPYTDTNWPILEAADVNPSEPGHILDFYKNESYPIVSTNREYNREHVWPQSRGFPQGGPYSLFPRADLHNLYLCDPGYNSSRSNNYYDECSEAECDERPTAFNNGVGGPSIGYPGNSNWRSSSTWRVWDDRKGDAARAVMYMAVRYNGGTNVFGSDEPDLHLTDDPELIVSTSGDVAYMGLLSVMRDWHYDDLPDAKEIDRHEVIFAAQENRNPFIDFPEWVDCVFFGDCSLVAPINPQDVVASLTGNDFTIAWEPRIESDLAGYHVYRSTTSGSGYIRLTDPDPVTSTLYSDQGIDTETTFYYVVTAIDTDGNESSFSIEVNSADVPAPGIAIPAGPGAPYVQDFDSMGGALNAELPQHFRVAKSTDVRTTTSWDDATTETERRGGDSLAFNAPHGIYNFGAGEASTATDRAVGFLSSGGGTDTGSLIAAFVNISGEIYDGLDISYNIEKYRQGSNAAGFSIWLYYSLDGEEWFEAPGFKRHFPADIDNSGYANAPGVTVPTTGTLSTTILNNTNIYLQWLYSVESGTTTTNAQALAIDDVSVFGILPPDTEPPTVLVRNPDDGWLVNNLSAVSLIFDEKVTGVTAGDLTVDGSPATDVTGDGEGPYVFTGYDTPDDGTVTIALAAGNIEDLAGNPFAGDSYTVELDSTPPEIDTITPGVSGLLNSFPSQISVTFTEDVFVDIEDDILLVSGSPAGTITGDGAGPYVFTTFDPPGEGAGTVDFTGAGVTDAAGNDAAPAQFNFVLDTVPPMSNVLTSPVLAVVGDTIEIAVDPQDATSGVADTELWVWGPSDTGFADSGLSPVANVFTYTAAESGIYRFQAISTDNAGNVEPDPDTVLAFVNLTENAPLELPIETGDSMAIFPMTGDSYVRLDFTNVTEAGTIVVSRTPADSGNGQKDAIDPSLLGLDANRLVGQYFTFDASNGPVFESVDITFLLDASLLGADLASISDVTTAYIERDGAIDEIINDGRVEASAQDSTVIVRDVTAFSTWYLGSEMPTRVFDWILMYE